MIHTIRFFLLGCNFHTVLATILHGFFGLEVLISTMEPLAARSLGFQKQVQKRDMIYRQKHFCLCLVSNGNSVIRRPGTTADPASSLALRDPSPSGMAALDAWN